jgi:O-methyltransferase involved in polyketide biosynthesis
VADKYKITRKKWNEANPEAIRRSQAKYNAKKPIWGFRPPQEIQEWLEQERWQDEQGQPEPNASLVIRKLKKLMDLEQQGF